MRGNPFGLVVRRARASCRGGRGADDRKFNTRRAKLKTRGSNVGRFGGAARDGPPAAAPVVLFEPREVALVVVGRGLARAVAVVVVAPARPARARGGEEDGVDAEAAARLR